MADNEIIKALERCSNAEDILVKGQTYKAEPLSNLFKDALDLINRQKAEIEEKSNKLRDVLPIVAELKAEAITEFAERLKLRVEGIPWCECKPVQNAIDDLAKEMKEGVNNA